MIKSSSWAIEMKMFTQLIFQNMKVVIDVFIACMIRVGCRIVFIWICFDPQEPLVLEENHMHLLLWMTSLDSHGYCF